MILRLAGYVSDNISCNCNCDVCRPSILLQGCCSQVLVECICSWDLCTLVGLLLSKYLFHVIGVCSVSARYIESLADSLLEVLPAGELPVLFLEEHHPTVPTEYLCCITQSVVEDRLLCVQKHPNSPHEQTGPLLIRLQSSSW